MCSKNVRKTVNFEAKIHKAVKVLFWVVLPLVILSYASPTMGSMVAFRVLTGGLMLVTSAGYLYLAKKNSFAREFVIGAILWLFFGVWALYPLV